MGGIDSLACRKPVKEFAQRELARVTEAYESETIDRRKCISQDHLAETKWKSW